VSAENIETWDAEGEIRDWLADALTGDWDDVQVFTPPSPTVWPARSVLITRTGGAWDTLIDDRAQITVESRAATPARALNLALHIRGLLGQLSRTPLLRAGVVCHGGREYAAPYHDPDPDNQTLARVTQTWAFTLRVKQN
jgi:hypothetical protein